MLKKEQKVKSQMMTKRIEKISREVSYLSNTITAIKENMGADDILFLKVINCL